MTNTICLESIIENIYISFPKNQRVTQILKNKLLRK